MAKLFLRNSQSIPLTADQFDANFTNLNNELANLVGLQAAADDATASAAAALASETAAAASATDAAAQVTLATTQATNAATSATNASTAQTAAELAETNAETAETNAETAETNAAASAAAAAASAASVQTVPAPTASGFGQLVVQNDADDDYQFLGQGDSGQILQSAGANALPVFVDAPYVISMFFLGEPDVSISIFHHVCEQAVEFPDDFAGSEFYCGTNPSSVTVIDIDDNGTKIGQVSVATNGTGTFTTTGSGVETLSDGDRISIDTPANLNGMADINIVLKGTETN